MRWLSKNTIYSIYKNQPASKGVVEIINLYDHRYFEIAIDGFIIESLYKRSFESTVVKPSFIKQCVEHSGVSEDKLLFVIVEWMDLGDENMPDYDANDCNEYDQFIDLLTATPNIKWKNKLGRSFVKEFATGIEQLEKLV